MNLTLEGVRTPFEIYPGVFVPPGTYEHKEAQLVLMTNQGAPVSLNMQTFIGGFFGGDRVTLNPTRAHAARRDVQHRGVVSAQRCRSAVGRLRHQSGADARVVFVQPADVRAGSGAVQRPRRPVVDELAVRLAAGGQHRACSSSTPTRTGSTTSSIARSAPIAASSSSSARLRCSTCCGEARLKPGLQPELIPRRGPALAGPTIC